jgi:hypothetical protein
MIKIGFFFLQFRTKKSDFFFLHFGTNGIFHNNFVISALIFHLTRLNQINHDF